MTKKSYVKFLGLLLVVGLLFAVAPTGQALAQTPVTTEAELRAAVLAGGTISLQNDITVAGTLAVSQPNTIINGNDHTLTFTGLDTAPVDDDGLVIGSTGVVVNNLKVNAGLATPTAWVGTYAINVFGQTGITLNNVGATGGNGGILVASSQVTFTGAIDVSGNGFGGIESSKASTLGTPSTLVVTSANFINTTEAYALPTIWEDGVAGTVTAVPGQFFNVTVGTQPQYYLNLSTYVDGSFTAATTGWGVTHFATIQGGIDAVGAGGTVHVAAGDYSIPSTMTLAKAITVSGPTTGEAKLIKADGITTNNIFLITASDVTIQNLTLTLNGAPTKGDAFIQAPDGAKANIQILNNKIYVDPQVGPMTGWQAQAIYFGRYTTNSKINNNTIYNTRSGAVAHYNCEVEYRDNVIYNTKGGIMNYASDAANALKRVMVNNSWGTVHNDWDIVWNSGAGVWDFDEIDLVLQMSQENNDAYVVTLVGTAPILGNRSHVFVNAVTGTETLHPANGNMNLPYKKIQDAIDAVVPGGTVNVAAGVYNENLTINKALTLQGAGDELVTVNGVAPTTDAGMLNIVASDVTIDGFKFVGQGLKTVRLNAPSTNVTFSNNTVIGAEYTSGGGWILFESNYNNAHSNLTITGNVFENHGGQIGVYLNPQITGLTFIGNTFQGTATSGPVLGIDGMLGTEVITGNTFNIDSTYALFEGFGTVPIVDIFNANTWPDGYIASGKKVVPASVVYPSTNDINRTNGWAHVNFISADASARTMTFEFVQNRTFYSCVEYRTSATPLNTTPNPNPLVLDGRYSQICSNTVGITEKVVTLEPSATYVEFRLAFGAEGDERFYWTPFTFVPEVWVDDSFTGTEEGFGITKFLTIQEGIDAVAAGGSVNVAAGTYNEGILLNKPNVTVKATDGAQTTFINTPAGTLTVGVQVLANMGTVTFDGFTVQNFTESGIVQGMASAVGTTFHVKNNVVTPAAGYLRNGIQVSGDGSTVIGNTVNGAPLTDSWASSGILAVNGSNILIEGNTILGGTLGLDIGIGVQSWSVNAANVIVRNNNISGANNGIRLEGSATTRTLTGVLIESNTITGSMRAINTQWVTLVDIDAQLNKFLNTTGEVLRISTSSALGSMDASHNWFGNALGPQNPIIGDIQVIKWCADAGCTTFLPDDDGKVTISGTPFTQTGAIKLYVDGVNYYLPAGTVIQNSSPCFEVYADNIKIYTDYPAAAKCVPTDGSDGIWVADGVESLRVVGLEFDGTGQTTGDGIHFAGVVTNFQIIENYFHDLDGDAIEFVGAPAGTIQDVYGNYFVGANSITLGAGTLNAAYNSWGTYAAPTAPAGVTVAPHTHAEIYVTPAVGGEVLKDTNVVFTVNGKIQSLTGAQFELSYPADKLQLVSAVANSTTWDQFASVDTSISGKITVALSAYHAVSGDPVEMLTLTFKALVYADDLTLTFSDTADVFSMYPLPEPNYSNYVYTFAQTGVTNLDIIGLPLVTITMGPTPYYAGIPIPLEVKVDNTNGGTYSGLTFNIGLPTLSVLEYYNGTSWVPATLPFAVGSLAPDQILTFEFRVTLDQPGSNTINVDLMNGTVLIGNDSETITIAGNFGVLGTFAMQGRTVRNDIPVTFTRGSYTPVFMTVDQLLNNLSGTLQYGGTYLITTNQARYLNVTADLLKNKDVYGDITLPSLTLKAGNAVWTGHATSNNQIDLADANQIGTDWGSSGSDSLIINHGDVNFDNIVNIQDLALVGGNYGLTSADVYGTWLP